MGYEVKTNMGGQAKHGLWKSNVKIGKYLAGGCWVDFIYLLAQKFKNWIGLINFYSKMENYYI